MLKKTGRLALIIDDLAGGVGTGTDSGGRCYTGSTSQRRWTAAGIA